MIAREAMSEAALLLLALWYGRKKFSIREAARWDFKNDWKIQSRQCASPHFDLHLKARTIFPTPEMEPSLRT